MSKFEDLFSSRIRRSTKNNILSVKFAICLRDDQVWAGGLLIFYHIYSYLEDAQIRLNMPEIDKLYFDKIIYRKKAFEDDLTHYFGEEWKTIPKAMALEKYLEHLRELEQSNPRLLLAYVYHLYLGLLTGGQVLAKKRTMFGKAKAGTYIDKSTDFTGSDIGQLKVNFRQAMNEIGDTMTEEEKIEIIKESNAMYSLNNLVANSIPGQNRVLLSLLMKFSAVSFIVAGVVVAYRLRK